MTDYPHPPLFEAVIELRYAGDGSQRAFEQAAKRIHKLYPVAQDIRAKVLAAEGVPSDAPEVVFLARHLSSADGADTVILHPDRVALSRKAPYLGWDDFTRRMREVLATAAPISKRRGLSRVGVRYIDRLDVPVASDVVFDYQEFVRVAANPLPFESGPVSGISLSAARDGEDHLSAAWPQFFDGTRDQVVDLAIHDVGQFVEIKANDRFALGVVGEIKTACADYGVHVRVVHDGEGYRSHAAVRRYGNATLELQERLASVAWAEMIKPTKAVVVASKRARKARD